MTRPFLLDRGFSQPGIAAAKKPAARIIPPSALRLASPLLISVVFLLASAPSAEAACSNPAGNAADITYNYSSHVYQYCNGSSWIAVGPTSTGPGSSTITLLQHTATGIANSATFGSTTTAHSLIVVCAFTCESETSYAVTDTAGNSFTAAVGPTAGNSNICSGTPSTQECLYAINKAATASDVVSVTDSPSNEQANIYIAEFSGIATSNPVDTTAANAAETTNPTSGSSNTSNANDLIFGVGDFEDEATPGSGFTGLDNNSGNQDEYEIETSTGSYAATFTASGDQYYIAQMVAFEAGTAAGGCTSPTGNEADMFYNATYHMYEYCNGLTWVSMGPTGAGGSCTSPSGNEADMFYNSSSSIMEYCNGTWVGMGY